MIAIGLMLCACGQPSRPTEQQCQAVMGTPQLNSALAWPRGDCIDVVWRQSAQTYAETVYAALEKWAAAPGTWLCFSGPHESLEQLPRTISVSVLNPTAVTVATTTFQKDTHELIAANLSVPAGLTLDEGLALHYAGQMLGFDATASQESVLELRSDRPTALTEADLQSVAAVYPACP